MESALALLEKQIHTFFSPVHKSLLNNSNFFESLLQNNYAYFFFKKKKKKSEKTGVRKVNKLAYFFMIDFAELFCSNSIGILFWKAIKGIS